MLLLHGFTAPFRRRAELAEIRQRLAAREAEAACLRRACADWRALYTEARRDQRRLTDACLSSAGGDPAFFPRPRPPQAAALRPLRRLRDWQREMEFLEAQAFARVQRGETAAGDFPH